MNLWIWISGLIIGKPPLEYRADEGSGQLGVLLADVFFQSFLK